MTRRKYLNSKHDSENDPGFDYTVEGVLMKNVVSPALYENDNISLFLNKISSIFVHLVNKVKNVKRWYIISVDIDDDNIN